jgi:F-type H+-transporting ATPase subunit a
MFGLFAAAGGPTVHVAPAEVFQIGGLTVTNSMLYGWVCAIFICVLMIWVARKMTIRPKRGVVQLFDYGAEFVTNLVESAFDDKRTARKYVPFFMTLFFFILLNNWLGLLPIVGEGFKVGEHPLLRPMTGDLNATLAMGLITMIVVYVASIREAGGFGRYIGHFFMGSPYNPLYFVIGLIEMLTDLTRVLSLSLRLFLNIAIGEIVIAVFAYLGHAVAPISALPFTLLELGVGALQAYIFVILGVNYLAISVNVASAHDDLTKEEAPETMSAVPNKAGA